MGYVLLSLTPHPKQVSAHLHCYHIHLDESLQMEKLCVVFGLCLAFMLILNIFAKATSEHYISTASLTAVYLSVCAVVQ